MSQGPRSDLPLAMNVNPLSYSMLSSAAINFSNTSDNTLVAGAAGKITRVFKLLLNVSAATNLTFKDGASTNLSGAMNLAANQGLILNFDGEPWYATSAGADLVLNQSGTAQVSGTVWYRQE